jgi:hypothetical protein
VFEELQIYLKHTTSPEHASIFINACKTLEENGIRSVGDYLEEFMATMNTRSTDETLQQLNNLLITQYEIALNQFGIFLVQEELRLKTLTGILDGVIKIENYDNPMTIMDICQSDSDPEEKLVEILELTTSLKWDDFLNQIEGVNTNLIERIIETLPIIEENEEVPKTETFILNRVKRLMELYPKLWMLEEVDEGCIIGQDIKPYIDKFDKRLEENTIENKPSVNQIAVEYLGYILLSNVPNEKIADVGKELLEESISDAVLLSKVSLEIDKILTQIFNK